MRLWILLVVAASVGQAAVAGTGCDPSMIMNCLFSVAGTEDVGNTNMLDVPDTAEKLKVQCGYTEKLTNCVNKVIDECGTAEEKEYIRKEITGVIDLNIDLCTEGSSLNRRFFANMNCFKEHSTTIKDCSVKFLGNLADAVQGDKSPTQKAETTCCAFHEYIDCSVKSVAECSKDAVDFIDEYFRKSLSSTVNQCTKDLDIPPGKCNAAESHNLNITVLFILLFIVSSKNIFFNCV